MPGYVKHNCKATEPCLQRNDCISAQTNLELQIFKPGTIVLQQFLHFTHQYTHYQFKTGENIHLHFSVIEQHAIHFFNGSFSSLLSLKMHKAVAFRAILVTNHLREKTCCLNTHTHTNCLLGHPTYLLHDSPQSRNFGHKTLINFIFVQVCVESKEQKTTMGSFPPKQIQFWFGTSAEHKTSSLLGQNEKLLTSGARHKFKECKSNYVGALKNTELMFQSAQFKS